MICALLLGREGSSGFPGKNITPVLGRPMAAYPLMAATSAKGVDRVYVSTDSPKLKEIGRQYGARIIERPPHLATKHALGEDAYVHGYQVIRDELAQEGKSVELMILLFANAVTLTSQVIEQGIAVLRQHPEYDSAVTVSCYNMWSPLRARKIGEDGLLHPFVPFETFGDPAKLNCDRDSQGDVWFADMGVSIVRPRCLENIHQGLLPQKWMGRKIYPLKQWGGFDVDEAWQLPMLQSWLQAHEIERLSKTHRVHWDQYYESERSIIAELGLSCGSNVFDFSFDAGGFGMALKERFNVQKYTALVPDKSKAEAVSILCPAARLVEGSIEQCLNDSSLVAQFDAVFGLGAMDTAGPLEQVISHAWSLVAPGGVFVSSFRLTDQPTDRDLERSFQYLDSPTNGTRSRVPYNVLNIAELLESMTALRPAEVLAYGYWGKPSSTATTTFKMVCFAVIAIRKRMTSEESETKFHLRLPENLVGAWAGCKSMNPQRSLA